MGVNLERVMNDMEQMAAFTATPGCGVTRLSYTKEDRMAKEYLAGEMKKIGLKVWEDGFATLFGRREGKNPDAPVIMIGSHYDSVTNGGAFDGTAGVIAALETLRVLEEEQAENEFPIEIAAMNSEEGHRFGAGTGVANSRAMVGRMLEQELDLAKDAQGISKREAMREYGFTPDLKSCIRKKGSVKMFLELHVEQSASLEDAGKDIGLIEFFPGIGRYDVKFTGKPANSAVPVEQRRDALLAASEFVVSVNKIAKESRGAIAGTVGMLQIVPNIFTYVPHYVETIAEFRIIEKEAAKEIHILKRLKEEAERIQKETNVEIDIKERARAGYPNPTDPCVMCESNNRRIQEICRKLGYSYMMINNGTGHDAMIMSEYIPTNMILVPSKGGISHHPDEWTDYEDLKKGIDVMLRLVRELSCGE